MGENVIILVFGYIRFVFYLSCAIAFDYLPPREKLLCGPCTLFSYSIARAATPAIPALYYLRSCARSSEAIPTVCYGNPRLSNASEIFIKHKKLSYMM